MTNAPRTIHVLDLLRSQHAEVDELIERLEGHRGHRRAVFEELADKLAAHATIEEKLFYPAVMSTETAGMLHEAVEEHLAVKRLLADMLELDPGDDETVFDAKLAVLKEQVSHHAHEEEEGKLFPLVRKAMSADELAGLGNEVFALFQEVLERMPRRAIADETDAAATLPG